MTERSAASTGRDQIAPLTGVRGIAACWVVCFHAFPKLAQPLGLSGDLAVANRGYLAVDLFFILSGFVLTMSARDSFANGWSQATKAFAAGRVMRILPLNAAVLIAVAVMGNYVRELSMAPAQDPIASFAASLLLVQAWWPGHSTDWIFPAWSLSAEWFAYVTFPFLGPIVFATRSRTIALAGGIVSLGVLFGLMLAKHSLSLGSTNGMALPRCITEFYAGAFLFMFVTVRSWPPRPNAIVAATATVSLILAVLVSDTDFLAPALFVVLIYGCYARRPVFESSCFEIDCQYSLAKYHSLSTYFTCRCLTYACGWHATSPVIIRRLCLSSTHRF